MNKAIRRRQYDLSNHSDLGSVRSLVAALLGLFVVTFNVVGALPAQAEGSNPLFAQAVMDDRIVICTATGLVVRAELDKNTYPKGVEVPDEQLEAVQLKPHDFHGEWNYTILPR